MKILCAWPMCQKRVSVSPLMAPFLAKPTPFLTPVYCPVHQVPAHVPEQRVRIAPRTEA